MNIQQVEQAYRPKWADLIASDAVAGDTDEEWPGTHDAANGATAADTDEESGSYVFAALATDESRYTYRFTYICWGCGQEKQSARSTTKTCGNTCRSRVRRERKKVAKAKEQILWLIGDLQHMCLAADPVKAQRAEKALLSLVGDLRDAITESVPCRT